MGYEHLEVWRGDAHGDLWLDALPSLVEACAERWSLDLGEPWTNSVASLTMPAVRRDEGERLVLKVQYPDREGEREAEALRRWQGDGTVRLVDHDANARALLLERCSPGTPLSTLDPEEALDVMIELLPRLWVPAAEPFRSLADETADLTR